MMSSDSKKQGKSDMREFGLRLLVLCCLALFGFGVVSAQGGLPPLADDQQVTITFYSYNLGSAGIGATGTEQLIAEFEALYPNINVEGVGVPSTDIMAQTQADVVAGNAPDVAQLIFNDMDFIVNNLAAVPLEQIVPADEWAAHIEGFHPRGLALGQLNGQTYGMAFTFSTPVLYYNATLFEAAGLDPDMPPTTWDEAEAAALQIVENTDAAGIAIYSPSWIAQALVMSNGGQVLSEDRATLMFGEPAAVDAMARLQQMVQSGAHIPQGVEPFQTFASGNMGMWLITSAVQNALIGGAAEAGFELRNTLMPAYGENETVPVNSGSALVVLSQDPLKQRAAWEFIRFVTSERGYTIITSQIGYLPLRPAIVDDPNYLAGWVEENPLVAPNLAQLDRLTPWIALPGPNYRQIEQIITEAQTQVIFTDADPTETLRAAQERAQALMP
jgi:multiple sugar transport system substrate-binding protein